MFLHYLQSPSLSPRDDSSDEAGNVIELAQLHRMGARSDPFRRPSIETACS